MRELRLDWRGGNFDLSKPCELYSIASTHERKPEIGNPEGRILVAISSTILYTPEGKPSPRPYNQALADVVGRLPGADLTNLEVWRGDNGYSTHLFNLTARGMLREWLNLLDQFFPWADGFHIDYFSAWSWLFPDMAESDQKWDDLLQTLALELRKRNKLVLGQQFHVTNPVVAANGAFVEQSPYAFRYTLAQHEADMGRWNEMRRFDGPVENIWTYEVREWQNWSASSLNLVKQWAEEQGVYLCLGRDGNVMP